MPPPHGADCQADDPSPAPAGWSRHLCPHSRLAVPTETSGPADATNTKRMHRGLAARNTAKRGGGEGKTGQRFGGGGRFVCPFAAACGMLREEQKK